MKRILPYCFLLSLGIMAPEISAQELSTDGPAIADELPLVDPMALYNALPDQEIDESVVNLSFMPKILVGYRSLDRSVPFKEMNFNTGIDNWEIIDGDVTVETEDISIPMEETVATEELVAIETNAGGAESNLPDLINYEQPEWFERSVRNQQIQGDLLYSYMIENPSSIKAAFWDLPAPPELLEEDFSLLAFLDRQDIPEIDPDNAVIPEEEVKKIHWLHKVSTQLQFSQAYVSPNWYQGGNNYLAMLFNFNWNVQLNQVYHPNLLFQSDLSYKVAFSSNPKGNLHKYTISEDIFQYNLNTGIKAAKHWFYSYNLQFKTQFFNNFEEDSYTRTAAFLSPADLNMGLGMSYNYSNKLKTLQLTLTISPLSYNLKACLKPNDIINHATYGIAADKHTKSEVGSNIEYTMDWRVTANISYKTRLFMFSNYKYFLGDWQNTISFDINKFLSTQIFVNLRYDGSTESYGKWKKFMMRELLSFGLSYTFATKP